MSLKHCVRAILNSLKFGEHGLLLMGPGHWNDGMNLVGEHGLIQMPDPPFEKPTLNPGTIKGYVPGVGENGGQYTRAAIRAEVMNDEW